MHRERVRKHRGRTGRRRMGCGGTKQAEQARQAKKKEEGEGGDSRNDGDGGDGRNSGNGGESAHRISSFEQ